LAEVSIREQVKKIVELQAVDSEIYALKKENEEKPRVIQELQRQFEDKKANLNALEEKLKQLQVKRKAKELELQSKEEEIKKAGNALFAIKTNKEYQAKLKEIEGSKADKSVLEEDILKIFDEADGLKAQVDKENVFLKGEEEKFNQEKKLVDERLKEIEQTLSQLDLKRKQIVPEIDKKILAKYERILVNREGLAMVAVKNDSCQGCFMNVPAQVINEIKTHEKLIICEVCARILYLEEDL
jgi:predicted  nucleic acid-binding Zn-ribbon protein